MPIFAPIPVGGQTPTRCQSARAVHRQREAQGLAHADSSRPTSQPRLPHFWIATTKKKVKRMPARLSASDERRQARRGRGRSDPGPTRHNGRSQGRRTRSRCNHVLPSAQQCPAQQSRPTLARRCQANLDRRGRTSTPQGRLNSAKPSCGTVRSWQVRRSPTRLRGSRRPKRITRQDSTPKPAKRARPMAGLFLNNNDVPSHLSTMTRLITKVASKGFEPLKLKTSDLQSDPFGRLGNLP